MEPAAPWQDSCRLSLANGLHQEREYASNRFKFASGFGLIQDLVDIELFIESQKVVDSLCAGRCSEALAWCAENKSSLKKSKSTFEFELRFQEFVELIRMRDTKAALLHVHKHLGPWVDTHLERIQQGMALLAFPPDTDCEPYKVLVFNASRFTIRRGGSIW